MSTESERSEHVAGETVAASSVTSAQPVLIVDDSGYARLRLRRFLEELGFTEVVEAADGSEAALLFSEHRPSLVFVDQVMRGQEGIETARLLLARAPRTKIVMLTVLSDDQTRHRALEAGILQVVAKGDWDSLRDFLSGELHD